MWSPVFTGGTGRSGTSITGKLIGAHHRYHMIPIEIRIITDPRGLCDLAAGRCSLSQFVRKLDERWWHRATATGQSRGLHKLMERSALDGALDQLATELESDGSAACRRFVHRILDPIANASGAEGWVEMTPPNALKAGELLRMFPDSRLVHSVRDGRDVAASVVEMTWGPDTFDEALEWWADSLREAAASVDDEVRDRVLVVAMEDLTHRDREAAFRRIVGFLDLDEDASMVDFFEQAVDPDRAHISRWTRGLTPDRRAEVDARYREIVAELNAAGLDGLRPQ